MITCDFLAVVNDEFVIVSWEKSQSKDCPIPDQGVYIPIMDYRHVTACFDLVEKGRKPIEVLASARVALDLRQLRHIHRVRRV